MNTEKLTFEQALEQLEERIAEMEQEALPLEEAMEKYEEAIGLLNHCRRKLDEAEKKVSRLTLKDAELVLEELDES